MGTATGYSKIATSGSVFLYDTGDTFNSWKGKPGTNIVTSIGYAQGTNTGTYYKTNYGTEIDNIPALGGDTLVNYINIYNDYPNSGNCCVSIFVFGSAVPLSGNTTYTYQLVYKTPAGENSAFMYRYEYGASGYILEGGVWSAGNTTNLGNGWKHAWGQFTTNANTTTGYFYMFFYEYAQWYHIQVYSCSITAQTAIYPPRQFIPVNSTRSNTQGLLDISGVGNSISLANMSFDSNAQMYFDGTDDKITVTCAPSTIRAYNSSTEFIVKLPLYSGGQRAILSYRSVNTMYIGKNSGGIFVYYNTLNNPAYTVGNIPDGSTVHVVVTCDANNNLLSTYINGTLAGSVSRTGWSATYNSVVSLGYDDGGTNEYMLGDMYTFKHYDRVLTAQEVLQNFNHYKTRFNIT